MLRLIDQEDADDEIARLWLAAIRAGDFKYFKEYMDRTEGKVADKLTLDSEVKIHTLVWEDAVAPDHDAAPPSGPADGEDAPG
jgi:hypothetical protein